MLEALVPVAGLFPGRSARWVADTCRAGRVPGAVKIGQAWLIRLADAAALGRGAVAASAPAPLTVEDAAAHLRALGVLA